MCDELMIGKEYTENHSALYPPREKTFPCNTLPAHAKSSTMPNAIRGER